MKKQSNKFYVVWDGRETGVFPSWDECKKRVEGYTGARYKGFPSLQEANQAFSSSPYNYIGKNQTTAVNPRLLEKVGRPLAESICVDAACSGNPGVLEYRGVLTRTGEEIFHRGPFAEGTTNIGEFLAIVTGLAWLKQRNSTLPLYSDSRNGLLWVKQKRINTKLVRTPKNEDLFRTVDKALEWLHNNGYDNRILKWETEAWGEIPADFGRK
jgi:ribonuclease HI